MPISILFWVLWVLFLLLGGYLWYPFDRRSPSFFIIMVLIGLLGWRVFGFVIQN